MVVIACNTASSVSLDALRSAFPYPIIGVIEPGARAAVAATREGKIGVIGTEATVRSSAYTRAIHALDSSITVTALACPLFVPLVEEGWTEGEITEKVAERYLAGILTAGIDTLVLGCTHYPLLKEVIGRVMGSVHIIDSAIETAAEVRRTLAALSLLRKPAGPADHRYFVTDGPEKFRQVGERFLGRTIGQISTIHLELEA